MRFFNTEGPVRPDDHYLIQPLDRMDVDEVLGLIRTKRYFVLRAPPQTGKTSALLALRDLLNGGEAGDFRCVHASVLAARAGGDDMEEGMSAILSAVASAASSLGDEYPDGVWRGMLAKDGADTALGHVLTRWCLANPTPLVLLLDDVDSLVGDVLLSVFRQIRAGHARRPKAFPQSVVLCGMHDVRGYRIRSTAGEAIAGGSPFNIVAESLRLDDFTEAETRALMAQHTAETRQRFSETALQAVWTQTQGQPWLVNALCASACFANETGRDRSRAVEVDDIHAARDEIILSPPAHIERLTHRLEEEPVRRVIEPMLTGEQPRSSAYDLEYARDLGIVTGASPPRIANPIYREIVSSTEQTAVRS